MKFQLYPRLTLRGRRWFWRLRADNGEIIASGEGYGRKVDALSAIEKVQSSDFAVVEQL